MKARFLLLCLALALLLCPPALGEDDLVLALSFEGDVQDASPLGNHGKVNKAAAYTPGVNGQALVLDGRTYIDLGKGASLQPSQMTFSCWIKADSVLSDEHMIAWFKPSGNYRGSGWYLSCLDDNTPLKLSVGPSAGQPMEIFVSGSRAAFFPRGEWVHIAVTYDSETHTCAIYRNGVNQSVTYINGTSEIKADSVHRKYLGFNSPGYNGGFARMTLDELTIRARVLSAPEIIGLYTRFGAQFDGSQVVETDAKALTLPMRSVRADLVLPTLGASGSTITWASSDESVLSADGRVRCPASGQNDVLVTLTATLTYGGCTMNKTFDMTVEAESPVLNLKGFSMGDVKLLDPYEVNAFQKEIDYLKSLDADRLLKSFCIQGGVESDAVIYGGWENSAIRGHTLGHYLSAIAQCYATNYDEELLALINHVVDVLAQCQNKETGYLMAIPEEHFDRIESGNTAGTWVPWYNLHKLMTGLLHAYEYAGNDQALAVASKLGDWAYSRTSTWSAAKQATVLSVEYGGINDALYTLYTHTGSEKHLSAAHSFDELTLFDPLHRQEDVLNGKHANTTIPKIVGALNRYITLGEGEEYYLDVAENFWEMVVSNHSYVTGGNSEWEHFGKPGILDAERTNCNCETCNTYNMLKLSRGLFQITGKKKYANYYENTFINAIMSSQNPETGMTTYFQPMATGYFKVYSTPDRHFWCCTGSGMENFSKLNDSIYFKDEENLYVLRYTASEVNWRDKGLKVTQSCTIPESDKITFTVKADAPTQAGLVLRVPDWCAGDPALTICGEAVEAVNENGFLRISRVWNDGDTVALTLPMTITAHPLPDNPASVAFKYVPVVLSAELGTESMTTGVTGVDVTVPGKAANISDKLLLTELTAEEWLADPAAHFTRNGDALSFTLNGANRTLTFTPHYRQHTQRYGIYFVLKDAGSVEDADEGTKYEVIDSLPVANDQYEFSHGLTGEKTGTGMHLGVNYRHAEPGGSFSYTMKVEKGVTNYLAVTYFSGDAGRRFTILAGGWVLCDEILENTNPGGFYTEYYPLPTILVDGRKEITITFTANQDSYAGGIFDKLSIVKVAK